MTTGNDAKDSLLRIETNLIIGLSAIEFYKNPEIIKIIDNTTLYAGDFKVECRKITELIKKSDRLLFDQYIKMLLRAYIKESFEVTKIYAQKTDNADNMKQTEWYHFARIIRNCLSHNFKFIFNNFDRKVLPVSWDSITITSDMEDTDLLFSFFGVKESLNLVREMHSFIDNMNPKTAA